MSTVSHDAGASQPRRWNVRSVVPEIWASIAISVMWLAVFACSLWGPDIVSFSNDGTHTTIPSGVAIALFAWLGTHAVARYAFRGKREDS